MRVLSLGLNWPGYEFDYSPPSTAEVKNEWSHTSTTCMCLRVVGRDKLYLYHRVLSAHYQLYLIDIF
jgi:hypothetical protein